MRAIITLVVASAALIGCRKQQAATDAPPPPPPADITDFQTGVVTTAYADNGCALLVEMANAEGPKLLIPMGLDEKFAKHGLKLKFKFTPSRAPQGSCMEGRPAVLEEVSILK
ncbi:MAG: hypothetical protein IPJ76_01785 [Flavobacteriales bacterium]|nr:MAG: hypothetical protein IPJ76_01785 [Flavobacteriales bacterium]